MKSRRPSTSSNIDVEIEHIKIEILIEVVAMFLKTFVEMVIEMVAMIAMILETNENVIKTLIEMEDRRKVERIDVEFKQWIIKALVKDTMTEEIIETKMVEKVTEEEIKDMRST